MYRSHNCGELRPQNVGQEVTLSGWVQKVRDKGGMVWVDLRDRYGITQLIAEEGSADATVLKEIKALGREYVIRAHGVVSERYAKNPNMPTGDIEVRIQGIDTLNPSETPPFTIENETDGGDELRMKYRYLDIRREEVKNNLLLRHKMMQQTRKYLDANGFIEVETPVLIKSTPEGARDFVVPSRMNRGEFYASSNCLWLEV
jgi:aspartyl-tRNA synthetase